MHTLRCLGPAGTRLVTRRNENRTVVNGKFYLVGETSLLNERPGNAHVAELPIVMSLAFMGRLQM